VRDRHYKVLRATGQPPSGADSELIVEDAFIVYYPSAAVAARHMNVLRVNAERLRGSIIRRAAITVLFVGIDLPQRSRQSILRCV
jgi:hypothetical protein